MPEQTWYCETCEKAGLVTYEERADIWGVYSQITDDHRKTSPKCPDASKIRVPSTDVLKSLTTNAT